MTKKSSKIKLADDILDMVHEINKEAIYPKDLKGAVIGYVERFGLQPLVLLDKEKCYKIFMDRDGMTYEDAVEFFYYNVLGAWMGEGTPCFASLPPTGGVY